MQLFGSEQRKQIKVAHRVGALFVLLVLAIDAGTPALVGTPNVARPLPAFTSR